MESLWKRQLTLAEINQLGVGCMIEHLGIRFTEILPQQLTATMPVDARTRQPFGLMHGGASVVLAETLGSMAGYLASSSGQSVVGIEVNASHHHPITGGEVRGVCHALQLGRQLQVWQTEIVNPRGKRLCTVRLTVMLLGE